MMDDTDAILRCERNWRYQQGYQDGYRDGKTDAQKLGQWIICGDGYYPFASGEADLELTDLKGVVKMMVGEATDDTQRSN